MKKNPVTLFTQNNLQEIECNYRPAKRQSDLPKLTQSKEVYEYLMGVWSEKIEYIEEFVIICLSRSNRAMGWAKISQGGLAGTVADPKVIFQLALKSNANSIIVAHNHPSGQLKPSEADIRLTRKLKEAGLLLDLPVLDHLIVSPECYYSFADEGMI